MNDSRRAPLTRILISGLAATALVYTQLAGGQGSGGAPARTPAVAGTDEGVLHLDAFAK